MKNGTYIFILPWEPHHPGGVNQVILNLYSQFDTKNIETKIWVHSWKDKRFRFTQEDGMKIIFRRLREPCPEEFFKTFKYWITLPLEVIRLAAYLNKADVRILNPHYPDTSSFTLIVMRIFGLYKGKIFLSFHGSDFNEVELAKGYKLIIWRIIFDRVDCVVACSKAMAERIIKVMPNIRKKIMVVYNGFDVSTVECESGNTYNMPEELKYSTYILNVATFEHNKGQDVLIKAFHSISIKYPLLKLVLVGRSGPNLLVLKNLVRILNIEKRVLFFCDIPHSEIAKFYKSSIAFILPSRIESFGIVILEAGAFRVPVIASSVGGIPEIINDPNYGILVPPDDPYALSIAIKEILDNPVTSKEKTEMFQQHVLRYFNWSRAANEYLNIIEMPRL